MKKQHSLLYTIATAKCPRCREGKMFPENTLYSKSFTDMHKSCPSCRVDFEREPGFYYGAMYVSFAINVGIFLVSLFILSQFVKEITMAMMIGVVLTVVIGFLPIIFRVSRAIWINIFIKYEGACIHVPKKI